MKQEIIASRQGPDYDWSGDHIFVKTASDLTGGRVAVVEDTLKPGFHLHASLPQGDGGDLLRPRWRSRVPL